MKQRSSTTFQRTVHAFAALRSRNIHDPHQAVEAIRKGAKDQELLAHIKTAYGSNADVRTALQQQRSAN